LITDLLKDRPVDDGVFRAEEGIDCARLLIVDFNRHLEMDAVVHEISHLEREIAGQLPLDTEAPMNAVRILVVRIDFEDDPVGRALSGRLA
jgi:hypothetical protein